MSKTIEPSWLPRITTPVAKDQADVLRGNACDYGGGLFAGYAGTMYASYRFHGSAQSASGGYVTVQSVAVPTDYRYVVQHIECAHNDETARLSYLQMISGGYEYNIAETATLAQSTALPVVNEIVLGEGDYLRFIVYALTAGSYMWLNAVGYTVRLQ